MYHENTGHQGRGGRRGGRGGRGGRGNKRGRMDAHSEPLDRFAVLLSNLLTLGDDSMPEMTPTSEALRHMVHELRSDSSPRVQSMFTRCVVQVHVKGPLYGVLLGMMMSEGDSAFVDAVMEQVVDCLYAEAGVSGDPFKAESALRFLASLVYLGLLKGTELVQNVLIGLVELAEELLASKADVVASASQPYSDFLVRLVLGALPFGGKALWDEELLRRCEVYIQSRPHQRFPSFRPFVGQLGEDDVVAEGECGAGGNLTALIRALRQMQESDTYTLESTIPSLSGLLAENCLNIATISLPAKALSKEKVGSSVDVVESSAVQLLTWYPPRGTLRLLKDEHTKGDRLLMDRIVAEDYFLHTMHFFEGDRVECAKRLARSIPLKYSYEISLCETIFGQMLRLPTSEYKTLMYSTLMVDLCKLISTFSRPIFACMKECFSRIHFLDQFLVQRLAEWLAYHVSNYNFQWPWERWAHVLEAPDTDVQKRFCRDVMARMVRLSYYDRVLEALPDNFKPLMPPKPRCQPLPSLGAPSEDLEGVWAAKAVDLIRKKTTDEQLDDWMKQHSIEAVLGGRIQLCKMLLRALLVAGQKTYSHMIIALERYYGPLAALVQDGGQEAQMACMDTIWQVWSQNVQRASMVVDRMMTLRLISAKAVVSWVFDSGSIKCTEGHSKYRLAYEALLQAINKVSARVDDARQDIALISGDATLPEGEKEANLTEKRSLLQKNEEALVETVTSVIERLIVSMDELIAANEGSLASFGTLPALAASGLMNPGAILLYDFAQFTHSLVRYYYESVALCGERVSALSQSVAKKEFTREIMRTSFLLAQ